MSLHDQVAIVEDVAIPAPSTDYGLMGAVLIEDIEAVSQSEVAK
jgi:hypothetical protein